MLWKKSASDRPEPKTARDVGSNLALPRRRRVEVDFGLKCGPLAAASGSPAQGKPEVSTIGIVMASREPTIASLLEGYRRSKVGYPEKTADKNRATVHVDCG
jgi:hypothetical protein